MADTDTPWSIPSPGPSRTHGSSASMGGPARSCGKSSAATWSAGNERLMPRSQHRRGTMTSAERQAGPLAGLRVVELAGLGPAPHACMVLADLGADVVRVERPVPGLDVLDGRPDHLLRGRRSFAAD